MKNRSENELIELYKNSYNQEIIGELYSRYRQLVYGSCLKYLKDTGKAEDAVNDIFIKISTKLKTHNVEHFKSWLYTLTRNHCIEILRYQSRHFDKKSRSEFMYTEALFHPDEVEDQEKISLLRSCLEKLAITQRKCIEMFYFNKINYHSIAESLNLNWNKVRSNIQNGRRNLKNCISESHVNK